MDGILLVLAMIPLGILVAFIALFVMVAGLRDRLTKVEARLAEMTRQAAASAEPVQAAPAPLPALPPAPQIVAPLPPVPKPQPVAETAPPPPAPPAPPAPQGPTLADHVMAWVTQNWFYLIAALSLALAGLYAAQYAAERGMLSPLARLGLAAGFGALLIAGGEVIRRRWGDGADSATAYLPSIFSGAGLVTLYGTVLVARGLYDMVTPSGALAMLCGVAALGVALGWFHGPFLAAMGILGATAAPFLIGGDPGDPWMIQSYFALVLVSGLLVNRLKGWPWIDGLSLAAPYAAACLVHGGVGGDLPFILLSTALPLLATLFPGKVLEGAPLVLRDSPDMSRTQIAIAATWGIAALFILKAGQVSPEPAIVALTILFGTASHWSRLRPWASDHALIAALALGLMSPAVSPHGVAGPELDFWLLLGAGLVVSLVAAWRSGATEGHLRLGWTLGAALAAPGLLVAQELLHAPAFAMGAFPWAMVVMGLAALATLLAQRAAQADGADRMRTAIAALAALGLVALAMFILLSQAALNVALGVLVLAAIAMDDRWQLKPLTWFAQTGIAVLIWRVLVDPGLTWAMEIAGYGDLFLAHALPAASLAAGWVLLQQADRPITRAALEGGFATVAGSGLSLLIARGLIDLTGPLSTPPGHLMAGLVALVWLVSGAAALRTALTPEPRPSKGTEAARILRLVTAGLSFLTASLSLLGGVTVFNPVLGLDAPILGPVIFSSLALGYLLPGLTLLALGARLTALPRPARIAFAVPGALLATLYLFLTVAQAWRGADLSQGPISDGEMWSYTALLLTIGAGLLVSSLRRRLTWARHLANAVLVLAIAKVFLLDAADMEGLVRIASFLVLGLALAGLAWINRKATLG